jgi:7-carboxy-7-deazaguanine synthase
VFTGGEPLRQKDELSRAARSLGSDGFRIEVETNGTIAPGDALAAVIDQWNVSPKLDTSGNPLRARLRDAVLDGFAALPQASFKFVVTSPTDLDEIEAVTSRLGIGRDRVVVMPEGTDAPTLVERSRWLAALCRDRGFRLGTRLHVLVWGNERGR